MANNPYDQFDKVSSTVSDLGVAFGTGANQLLRIAGDLYGLAADDMDNAVSRQATENIEYLQRRKSPELVEAERARKAATDLEGDELGKALTFFRETVKNPLLAGTASAEAVPSLVGAGGAGAATRVATGKLLARKGAEKAAEQATKAGVAAAVGTGAAMQGTSTAGDQYRTLVELLNKMPDEQAAQLPQIKRLMEEKEASLPEAKAALALDLARSTGILSALTSAATQMVPGGRTIEKTLVGGPTKRVLSRVTGAAKGAAGEALQEAAEEGSGTVIQNIMAEPVEPGREITKGLGESVAGAAIAAGPLGAVAGTAGAAPESPRPVPEGEAMAGMSGEPPAPVATRERLADQPQADLSRSEEMTPEQFWATMNIRQAKLLGGEPNPEDVSIAGGLAPANRDIDPEKATANLDLGRQALEKWRQSNPTAPENIVLIYDPEMQHNGYGVQGAYNARNGNILINTAFVAPERIGAIVNHEWAHSTLATVEGQQALAKFAEDALKRVDLGGLQSRYGQQDPIILLEEWIAENQEKAPSVIRDIIARVREWLSQFGIVDLNDGEVADIMLRTLRELETGKVQPDTDVTARVNEQERYSLAREKVNDKAFMGWFQNSRVVERDGETPRLMYHGTHPSYLDSVQRKLDFNVFRPNQKGLIFATPTPQLASRFATNFFDDPEGTVFEGARVYPVFISAQNPFDYENPTHLDLIFGESTGLVVPQFNEDGEMYRYDDVERYWVEQGDWSSIEKLHQVIRNAGFDGLYVLESGAKNIAVFSPDQIKSAYGNVGSYGQRPVTEEEAARYNMTAEQADAEQTKGDIRFSLTPELMKFARGSVAVDETGKPQVYYHGTPAEFEGNIFKSNEAKNRRGNVAGYYFTPEAEEASWYTGDREGGYAEGAQVLPVYLAIKDPFIPGKSFISDAMKKAYREELEKANPWINDARWFDGKIADMVERRRISPDALNADGDAYQRVIKAGGYDGFQDGRHLVAFDPNQIKSAIGNVGSYGQRPVTEEEAARTGMGALEANQARRQGDIRFSLSKDQPTYESPSQPPVETPRASVLASSGLPEQSERGRPERGGAGDSVPPETAGRLSPLRDAPVIKGASGPDPRIVEVAERYARDNGIDLKRQGVYVDVNPEFAARIAQAYEEMPHAPSDPKVREAYEDLIRQTRAQYDALVDAGYKFYFYDSTNDPYGGNPFNAIRDLRENQRMAVYATGEGFGSSEEFDPEGNPLLADTGLEWGFGSEDGPKRRVTANDLFRAVHDAFGHSMEGAGFRARGEENAWQAHRRLFTGPAVGAMTSETRGQNSWLNYGPAAEKNRTAKVEDTVFADQKTGLMPEWTWTENVAPDEEGTKYSLAQTKTPEFKRWFGDSMVVDNYGLPKVVFHGAPTEFTVFDPSKAKYSKWGGIGSWFSEDPSYANSFRGGFDSQGNQTTGPLLEVYLSLKEPAVYEGNKGFEQLIRDYESITGVKTNRGTPETNREFVDKMKELGFDGIVVKNHTVDAAINPEPQTFYVAFDPTQIKSATGNVGTFDPENPDIRYSLTSNAVGARALEDAETMTFKNWATASKYLGDLLKKEFPGGLDGQSPETLSRLADLMDRDLSLALTMPENADAIGWYNREMKTVFDILRSPELDYQLDDPVNRGVFNAILAITSNGQKVIPQFLKTAELYNGWRKTGLIPPVGKWGGERNKAIKGHVKFLNEMLRFAGPSGTVDYLTSEQTLGDHLNNLYGMVAEANGLPETATVKDKKAALKKYLKVTMPSGELVDYNTVGAAVFGPKLGGGFFANLYGKFDRLTMDRWFMRTFHRLTGRLGEQRPKMVADILKEARDEAGDVLPEDVSDEEILQEINTTGKQAYKNYKEIKKRLKDNPDDTEAEALDLMRRLYNRYVKAKSGLFDAPDNGTHRKFIREVVDRVQKLRAERGDPPIDTSDIQAILWYLEKDIWNRLRKDMSPDVVDEADAQEDADDGDTEDTAGRVSYSDGARELYRRKVKKDYVAPNEAQPATGG